MSFTITKSPDGVVSVTCQTPEQVRDVLNVLVSGNGHSIATNGATTAAATATTAPATTDEKTPVEVLEPMLPLIEGSVQWTVVDRVAKQINWTGDRRTLRSRIVAKRKAEGWVS